jgi:hypothetical protein
MNPMLLADWGRIHRMFRTLMWLAAIVMACVVVTLASPHVSGARQHSTAHSAGKLAAPIKGPAVVSSPHLGHP